MDDTVALSEPLAGRYHVEREKGSGGMATEYEDAKTRARE